MRSGELRYLYEYMAEEPVARAALWSWFKANYGLVVKRVSTRGMSHSVGILSNACDTAASKALADFFGPKVGDIGMALRRLGAGRRENRAMRRVKYAKGREIASHFFARIAKKKPRLVAEPGWPFLFANLKLIQSKCQ